MREVKAKHVREAIAYLKKSKAKYVSLEMLSSALGLYSDALGEELTYFAPSIMLDASFNVRSLLPYLEAYLEERKVVRREKPARKKEAGDYASVADFVYRKLTTAGGLIDPSIRLSDHDLRLLIKVAREERLRLKEK